MVQFTVVDQNNESISGAEVTINDLGLVAYSDLNGKVSIEIPTNSETVVNVSFISFAEKSVNLKDIKHRKITLFEE